MRAAVWGAVLIALAVARVGAAQAVPSPEEQLAPLLDSQLVAANAHDTDRFLRSFLHDSSLVQVFDGVVTRGFDQIRALQLRWWQNGSSDVVYRHLGPPTYLVLTPDVVVVTEPLASQRTGADGKTVSGAFTVTMVWQRRAEGWRVVYQHESLVR
jgi:uncharacterized protein (TIGR02246 family)